MSQTTTSFDRAGKAEASLQSERSSWGETLAGTIPFIIPLMALGVEWASWRGYLPYPISSTVGLAVSAIPLLSLSAGWAKGFPRWSYPYAGLVMALPCLTGFWVLFLVIGLILLLPPSKGRAYYGELFSPTQTRPVYRDNFTIAHGRAARIRSWRPLRQLGEGVRRDWTLLSFGFYGIAPMALVFAFDEVARDYKMPHVTLSSLILAVGALAYMRSTRMWQRALALLSGITLSWATATLCLARYWDGRQQGIIECPGNWRSVVEGMVDDWGKLVALLLTPVILSFIYHLLKARQTAQGAF